MFQHVKICLGCNRTLDVWTYAITITFLNLIGTSQGRHVSELFVNSVVSASLIWDLNKATFLDCVKVVSKTSWHNIPHWSLCTAPFHGFPLHMKTWRKPRKQHGLLWTAAFSGSSIWTGKSIINIDWVERQHLKCKKRDRIHVHVHCFIVLCFWAHKGCVTWAISIWPWISFRY